MGNIVNKYKVNELAKDFGMQTKQIIEILGKYFPTPKKSGQNLEEQELNVVFEYLTQNNQVGSIQDIYADSPRQEKPAQEKPAAPVKDAPAAQPPKGGKAAPAAKDAPAPAQGQQQAQKPQQGVQQQPDARVPKTKVVDTRKATNVNLDKYDEKLQDMADRSGRSGGGRRDREQNKEKFRNAGNKKRGQMSFSSKR